MKLSVIIPVYNEVEHILEIVKRVQSTKMTKEIIIVDDGSEDGTRTILQELDGLAHLDSRVLIRGIDLDGDLQLRRGELHEPQLFGAGGRCR